MQWYALDRYVATLVTHECSSQASVDQTRTRKHVGRKRLKTGVEGGGDCKSQRAPGGDDDDDENAGDDSRNDEADAQLPRYLCSVLLHHMETVQVTPLRRTLASSP